MTPDAVPEGGNRATGPERTDLRGAPERWIRGAWSGRAPALLRAAGALFGFAAGLRSLAFEAGLAAGQRTGVPVLSVGSLAVGGSGKTPLAAAAARWCRAAGASPAVVTPGFADEVAVHRSLNPSVPALGRRDRAAAVRRACRGGADVVILDDGFQHRRLARDLDWVAVDERRLERGGWRLLPAGPGREPWRSLARADAVVLTRRVRRSGAGKAPTGRGTGCVEGLRGQFPAAAVARCELRAGPLLPVNAAAAGAGRPRPRVAFASIMKGEDFLEALRGRRPELEREYLFTDHHPVPDARLEEMIRSAGEGGMVGTRKDVVKVAERVAERTPLWCASEELAWTHGASRLRRQAAGLGGRA